MTREAYNQGRIRHAQQDGNREFISLLACVCADGTALPPALIYQGASNDLQNSWMDDLNEQDKAYFTSSANGWTCNDLGLAWLRRFDRDTRHKGNRRRLLILDGHSSHINMALIALADSLRILILVLPPHTTHRLQPLDVGLFSPLANAYSKRLDAYTHGGLGWVSMTKRLFWPLFRDAWEASFTVKNIQKAFETTGIWPLNPSITLNRLRKASSHLHTPSRLPPLSTATPLTVRGIRRLVKSSSSREKEALLERAVLRLATKFDIQSFENRGLRMAITQEKKRRQRGKRLNLLGEEATAAPQFFSPQRVLLAKAYQEGKEQAEEEGKRQRAIQKEEAAYKRRELQAEKQELAIQRQLRKEANQEAKAAEKAQKALEREEKRRQKEQEKQQKALLTRQRKEEQKLRKQLTIAAKQTAASKTRLKRASATPSKVRKRRSNPISRAIKATVGPQGNGQRSKQTISPSAAGAGDLAAVEAQNRSRRGRVVTLPQRFIE